MLDDKSGHEPDTDSVTSMNACSEGIEVSYQVSATGEAVIAAAENAVDLYDSIAVKIKAMAEAGSCDVTYGTDYDDGRYEGFASKATTSGPSCDTKALLQTLEGAVQQCADRLNNERAMVSCCWFSDGHGGTWTGHLMLTADLDGYPVTTVSC
jgi:hypothetical protein